MKSANEVPLKIGHIQNTSGHFTLSVLRLFNGVPVTAGKRRKDLPELTKRTLENGFVFSPVVIESYTQSELYALKELVAKEKGITPDQMNSSFHKSWAKVRDSSIYQLVYEQLVHYFTTYGFERLGIYSQDSVYIPSEELKVPELKDGVKVTVIHGYTKNELKKKLEEFLSVGIALKEETVNDVVIVAEGLKFKDVDKVKNKEVRTVFYDKLEVVPKSPEEFVRLVLYKKTGKTLIIKNPVTIKELKESKNSVSNLFKKYGKQHGLEKLAEVFYRYKPLFLALKTENGMSKKINRLRRLANNYHKPMKEDFLNNITSNLKNGIKKYVLAMELSKVNTFRKVRLAQALSYRMLDTNSILYKVRNGKSYATEFTVEGKAGLTAVYDIVISSIIDDIGKNVRGKNVFISKSIVYALPATEKQFTGNIPSGSYITIPNDMVVGVYWENLKTGNSYGNRIDLDLSLLSQIKYGWDARYREGGDLLFSGDMTDAHNGASELYYIGKTEKGEEQEYLMFLNYYNISYSGSEFEVPYKFILAKEAVKNFRRGRRQDSPYMVDFNNLVLSIKSTIKEKQKVLGLITTNPNETRFYFSETTLGDSITSSGNEYSKHAREYLTKSTTNIISLNDVLKFAGAKLVSKKEEAEIDLSPENITKETFLSIMHNKEVS